MKNDNLNKVKIFTQNTTVKDALSFNKPLIFNKKNSQSSIIPLKTIKTNVGITRYFPPASQEWDNSIYTYNSDYVKSLPIADKNLMKLVKSYFNMYFSNKILESKQLSIRYKRLSVKKIFVAKGELKHTSSKIIITLYVFNKEKNILKLETKKLIKALVYPNKPLNSFKAIENSSNIDNIIKFNRPLTLNEYMYYNKDQIYSNYLYTIISKECINNTINSVDSLNIYIKDIISRIEDKKINNLNIDIDKIMYTKEYKEFIMHTLSVFLKNYYTSKASLSLNRIKFEESFLTHLKDLVSKIYKKEIEFNIVQLKKLHLNSDIFTQAIALKLKNRDNKLYRVLKSVLTRVKVKKINKNKEKNYKMNRNNSFINSIMNTRINSLFNSLNNDNINNYLLNLFPTLVIIDEKNNKNKLSIFKENISSREYINKYIKHINLFGIRIEAKGRLTRRFTASRSVFKVKWKGGLKNIDSSFRGLSSVMLRGHAKSNIQYSVLNSKNRNGAFGVKGWVSNL
uniref:Small ribosomal subunit protein uS3m n=1 Tax=Scytalidium sp. TaxID=1715249 RepID=A0A513U0T5_9PEZI|nr:ribosomal protein S3 [Scytalidium sp.]